ncbi:hypothetical protein F441_11766 [Phytophthora nicotianae CJ01A1]|uniref:Uncharacterized protein n=1 Tax=Phytophthora nicotianae CJ01A1 TaxID=1317063 RepID=W2WTQ9_PHYNI|nr:hypothetical protein F441_11766 [Phytophthora nicotianae CJ01A1]
MESQSYICRCSCVGADTGTKRKRCPCGSAQEEAKRRRADRDRIRHATADETTLYRRRLRRRQQNRARKKPHWSSPNSNGLNPPRPDTISRLFAECGSGISIEAIQEKVCCVCDCHHVVSEITEKLLSRSPALLRSMQKRLKPPANLPSRLLRFYSVASVSKKLKGLLLSRSGITIHQGIVKLQVCNSCYFSLMNRRATSPPKFAIANGLYIGVLPSRFHDTTVTENSMLNLAQPTQFVSVVRGGRHSTIRAHSYYFRANPAPPARLLPEKVASKGIIGVSMVGAMTERQKAETAKRYAVRVTRLRDQYGWYRANNKLYRNVELTSNLEGDMNCCLDAAISDAATSEADENQSGNPVTETLDASNWRFNAPPPAYTVAGEADETCVQTAVALITNYTTEDINSQARRVISGEGDVAVWRSSELLSDFATAYWTHAFCDLFPFGRGGLDEPRLVRISITEYLRYCLRLSHRRHESHPSFVLVAFDVLARHRSMRAVYLRAKLAPRVLSSAASVDRSELLDHVEFQEKRLRAMSRREQMPDPPQQAKRVSDLFSGISTGLRAHWGTNEERSDARTKVMSMQLDLGQPSIFFTLSPSSSGTYHVGNLAGDIPSCDLKRARISINHCLQFTQARLGMIATKNPTACARYVSTFLSCFQAQLLTHGL